MILALGKSEHFRNIVEIDERLAHVEDLATGPQTGR
jgi:hypothetical protein